MFKPKTTPVPSAPIAGGSTTNGSAGSAGSTGGTSDDWCEIEPTAAPEQFLNVITFVIDCSGSTDSNKVPGELAQPKMFRGRPLSADEQEDMMLNPDTSAEDMKLLQELVNAEAKNPPIKDPTRRAVINDLVSKTLDWSDCSQVYLFLLLYLASLSCLSALLLVPALQLHHQRIS